MKELAERDATGAVATIYDRKTTPEMVVFSRLIREALD